MSVRAKCRLIQILGLIVTIPGVVVLVYETVPLWAFLVVWPSFWLGGCCFVISMIGDGKEGLGLKKPPDNVRG